MNIVSVLDQSPATRSSNQQPAIIESLDLARLAERLGFKRFWIAEHHSAKGFAIATPEVMIAAVAAVTHSIRVGSGGILLATHAPLRIAEAFRLLEALHPGRIDLGIGRGTAADPYVNAALSGPRTANNQEYTEKLGDLYGFIASEFPNEHPYSGIRAVPHSNAIPELWLLGSTMFGASVAARFGWPFAFAHFLSGDNIEAVEVYRQRFIPSPVLREPKVMLALSAICVEHDREIASAIDGHVRWRMQSATPWHIEDGATLFNGDRFRESAAGNIICGRSDYVYTKLCTMSQKFDADELMVLTVTGNRESRLQSYRILAEAFSL